MLWLLSMSRPNVTGVASWLARLTVCSSPFSRREKSAGPSPETNRPFLKTAASSISAVTSASSFTASGFSVIESLAVCPCGVCRFDDDLALEERVVVDPIDRVRRLGDGLQQLAVHENAHGGRGPVGLGANLRDDADAAGDAGSAKRGGDADGQRRRLRGCLRQT